MSICPIGSKRRAAYFASQAAPGTGEAIAATDAVRVTNFEFTPAGEGTIDRSDVFTLEGGAVSPVTGSISGAATVTTEMYAPATAGDASTNPLTPLFAAMPVTITEDATPGSESVTVTPRGGFCAGTDYDPLTCELHELNGNKYRLTDAVCLLTMSAEPGARIICQWAITGQYETPTDAPGLTPNYVNDQLPLVYKNAQIIAEYDDDGTPTELDIGTCGALQIDLGMVANQLPSACTPDGAGFDFVQFSGNVVLTLGGVAVQKESVAPVWALAEANTPINLTLRVAVYDTDKVFEIRLPNASLSLPTVEDTNGYLTNSLVFNGAPNAGNDQFTLYWGVES